MVRAVAIETPAGHPEQRLPAKQACDAKGNLLASRHAPTNAAPAPANLAVSIAYPDVPALAGAPFRCVVTLTNAGPGLARNTRLTNALPAGATVLATTNTQGFVTAVNGLVALDLGALAPNSAAVVELTLLIPAPSPPPLVATVASGVLLTSPFSTTATFIAATSSAGTITTNTGEVVFDLGTLAPGATATASLTVAPTTAGSFTNLVTLAASEPELTPADNALTPITPTQIP